ncbi:MAG: hypothetical protein R2932_16810 [Caldilineaceae bacterium]
MSMACQPSSAAPQRLWRGDHGLRALPLPGPASADYQPTNLGWGFIAGLGGIIGGTVGTSGPPYVICLSYRLRDKSVLRATSVALFAFDGLWRVGLIPPPPGCSPARSWGPR